MAIVTTTGVSGEDIIASSPGDIVIQILPTVANAKPQIIPLKTFGWQETNNISDEYGIGWHEKFAQVQGKKGYKIDFTIGSWWVDEVDNPATYEHLINDYLLYKADQRLSREFDVLIMGREGADYQSQRSGPVKSSSGTIDHFRRCLLADSGGEIPEVGNTVSRKYTGVCFTIV